MSTQSHVTPAAALLFLAAIGPALGAQIVRQRDAQGREVERRCQPAVWPKKLPVPDALLDSAALSAALQALPEGDTSSIILSLLYQDGTAPTVRPLDPQATSSPMVRTIVEALSRGLRPLSPSGPFGAIRLRLQGGAQRRAAVDRSVFCPPLPEPSAGGDRRVSALVAVPVGPEGGGRLPTPGQRIRIEAEVSIDAGGHVTDVRLITGSGIRELDEEFLRDQQQRRFLPAMLDGFAVPVRLRTNGPQPRL